MTRPESAKRETARREPARSAPAEESTAGKSETANSESPASIATANPATEKPEPAKATRTRPVRIPRRPRVKAATAPKKNSAPPVEPSATPQPAPAQAAISARLIIETKDGVRLERDMNAVRRVTIENGMILIIMKDGKTERQPLINVLRMSIEP